MAFNQRIEKLIIQLETVIPSMEKNNQRIAIVSEKIASIESTMIAYDRSLTEAWTRINELSKASSNRLWVILMALFSGGLSFTIGYILK